MIFENINNNMDALLEALRPSSQEVTGLSGKESFLANLEAKQMEELCSECSIGRKECSNYCQSCWDSKMMN
tara:strand:- start:11094 stop:11306 length:213 start_codon:yes stop_codon:yes gene_type:complete